MCRGSSSRPVHLPPCQGPGARAHPARLSGTDMAELVLFPENGPPVPASTKDLRLEMSHRARACAQTVEYLHKRGMTIPTSTPEDRKNAAAVLCSYAAAPDVASRHVTTQRMGSMTPAALRHIDQMLKTFGSEVVDDAVQIRHYVTNKLLEETDNPDPRIRVKALELLGKITDVGLFTERREVTVTHQSTEDLRESLRQRLSKLTVDSEMIDVTPVDEDLTGLLVGLGDVPVEDPEDA